MTISVIGFGTNDPRPGVFIQELFAAGPASSGSAVYGALIMGNMTSAGSATKDTVVYGPNTPVALTSTTDAINLFGDGSELHRGIAAFLAVNTSTPLYALAISEGVSAGASSGTITVTGTATGPATLRVWVGPGFVDTGIATGDTVITIGTNVANSINSKTHWAVTATASAGVVTLTSKNKGLRANTIRYFAQVLPSASVTTTVTPTASTLMSGGTVSDSNATALSTILGTRYYYICEASDGYEVSTSGVDSNLLALLSQVESDALPTNGRTEKVFAADTGTLAQAIAVTTAANTERMDLFWSKSGDVVPFELACSMMAIVSLEEDQLVPRCNFAFYGNTSATQPNWKLKAPTSLAVPTSSEILSALNSGVSPIGVNVAGGTSFLVKRVTSRWLNGSNPDYRIRESCKVTIEDRFADDLRADIADAMDGKVAGNDPSKGQPEPATSVFSPRNLLSLIKIRLRDYEDRGLIENLDGPSGTIANIVVERETSPSNRFSGFIPLSPVSPADQAAVLIAQVS